MFRCYLINFGWFLDGEFKTVPEAVAYGKTKGFEFTVVKNNLVYASYSPLSGLKLF